MAYDFTLTFDFETPLSAEALGEVVAALGRDYREFSDGRELVVTRIETGSIVLTLTDAALTTLQYASAVAVAGLATIQAINSLSTFADNLKKWFGRAKTDEGKRKLSRRSKKTPGQRSVEAITKVAAASGSAVTVRHIKPDGEILEASLTPAEAIAAQPDEREKNTKVVNIPQQRLLEAPAVREAMKRLEDAGRKNLSPTQVDAIVGVVVAVLNAAYVGHLLPEIASELDARGLGAVADAIREHIRPRGATEPPVTTT